MFAKQGFALGLFRELHCEKRTVLISFLFVCSCGTTSQGQTF